MRVYDATLKLNSKRVNVELTILVGDWIRGRKMAAGGSGTRLYLAHSDGD
jgi:hypothetical protein